MKLNVTLGHGLAEAIATPSRTGIDQVTCAPSWLLSWIESQLGLTLPETSFTHRTIQYLGCLRELDAPDRFYHRSFHEDELGAASELLRWRDECYEAGWDGRLFSEDMPARIRDLAEVEAIAAPRIAPNTGQRVQRVLSELEDARLDNLTIKVIDPEETFSNVWKQLLRRLDSHFHPWALSPQGTPGSDLYALQSRLLEQQGGDTAALSADASVLVLRDGSHYLSAPWIAAYAHQQLERYGNESCVILAERCGGILDDALTETGRPRLGFASPSFWRPVFQVLPLAMELIWGPLDPSALLQFLAHPVAPVRNRIRRALALVVAHEPGIGGDRWKEALDEAIQRALDDSEAKDGESHSRERRRKAIMAEVSYWLECERHDPQQGAPISIVIERTRRVIDWLRKATHHLEDIDHQELYAGAWSQASELLAILESLEATGVGSVRRDLVRRLIEAVRGEGMIRPGRERQCAPHEPQLRKAHAPSGVLEPAEVVIWWGCDQERVFTQLRWSPAETRFFEAHGVRLNSLKDRLSWRSASWLRPILAARRQLVLVLHDEAKGHHPVFDRLLASARGWAEHRIERLIGDPTLTCDAIPAPETTELVLRELPSVKRWWHLTSSSTLMPREQESASSLEKFLSGPYQWVLDYKAKLRKGTLVTLDDGKRLKGNLVHQLYELYFAAHPDIGALDADSAGKWVHQNAPDLIERVGAVLLTAGRRAEREDFIHTAADSLQELIRQLQAADIAKVTMEGEQAGTFLGGPIGGVIDMLVVNSIGKSAIIDIKWGSATYREASLRNSEYLQLATYGLLCKTRDEGWPILGYYIISDRRLITMDGGYFPEAVEVFPDNRESVAAFWERVEHTWRWRREQLDRGVIEVPVTGTTPDRNSSPGEGGLALPETYDRFHHFGGLTGWTQK